MANISAPAQALMLDWLLGGATPTRPASRLLGLSIGTPTSVSASEMLPATAHTRQTVLFGPAASPAGSASNTAALTFGPFASAGSALGAVLFDTSAFTAGTMLLYNTLSAAKTFASGEQIVFQAGSLVTTLA